MKRKYKTLVILFILVVGLFVSSMTYSIFISSGSVSTTDQKIAQFVFDAKKVDSIELPLTDLNPGDMSEYLFSVSNNLEENISNVVINYRITIKTFHFIPLVIKLYKTNNNSNELLMACDESYTRNEQHELVCNSSVQELDYRTKQDDTYKIEVSFPSNYNNWDYSNLVDYIDINIKSWQKM